MKEKAEDYSKKVNRKLKKAYEKLREKKTSLEISAKGVKRKERRNLLSMHLTKLIADSTSEKN